MINEIDYSKQSVISTIQMMDEKMNNPIRQDFDSLYRMDLEQLEKYRDEKLIKYNHFIENPLPFINLNGNAEKTLLDELYETSKLIRDASNSLCRMQMFHGRNSTDIQHMQRLRDKKLELNKSIWDVYEYLTYVASELNYK
jgi:hypothetical protein